MRIFPQSCLERRGQKLRRKLNKKDLIHGLSMLAMFSCVLVHLKETIPTSEIFFEKLAKGGKSVLQNCVKLVAKHKHKQFAINLSISSTFLLTSIAT